MRFKVDGCTKDGAYDDDDDDDDDGTIMTT